MATKRIKDITNTATTFASDDFIALDGSTQGTRKMDKDDLISQVSAGVSGDYLEEANNLSDVASKDTSKLNLEVPDVGTAPNEVPLNGQLGSMAYQSAEAVSIDKLEVTDKVDGSLGINTTPTATLELTDPTTNVAAVRVTRRSDLASTYAELGTTGGSGEVRSTDNLVLSADFDNNGGSSNIEFKVDGSQKAVIDSSGNTGFGQSNPSTRVDVNGVLTIDTDYAPSSAVGGLALGDYQGGGYKWVQSMNSQSLALNPLGNNVSIGTTSATHKLTVAGDVKVSSGNVIIGTSGKGIDFSATGDGSGTMTSEVLDDYEEGTWTPTFGATSGAFTTLTMDVVKARYVKIGHLVNFYCYIRTDDVDTTGTGGHLTVGGLPYANAGSDSYVPINVGFANFWTNAPAGGYVYSGGDYMILAKRLTSITGALTGMAATADLTSGTTANQNQLMISGSYYSF